MDHADHIDLIREGVETRGGRWADLGCGTGAFTLALAELLGRDAHIYAIDREEHALSHLEERFEHGFPGVDFHPLTADFRFPLELPALDGIVMANSLHFYKEKAPIVRTVRKLLAPTGRFILVEYNVDSGNTWVPHPISYRGWQAMAEECGFSTVRKIGSKPSSFLREIYATVSW